LFVCSPVAAGAPGASEPDNSATSKKIDLSRLDKHIALIHALRDVDPESPHGQELAAIIEGLAESSG